MLSAKWLGRAQVGAALGIVSLLSIIVGQFVLTYLYNLNLGLFFFIIGGALFLLALLFYRSPIQTNTLNHRTSGEQSAQWLIGNHRIRTGLFAAGLACNGICLTLVVFKSGQENTTYWEALVFWLAGMALLIAPFLTKPAQPKPFALHTKLYSISVLALVLLAFFLRIHQLGSLPIVMEGDEADIGRQVLAVIDGQTTNFFSNYRSYGILHFLLLSLPVKILGPTKFALRLFSVFAGLLTVPALAVFARRLFGLRVGFASTALYTASHMALQFSHITIAGTFDPFFAVITMYFIHRGLTTRQLLSWLLAGLAMGVVIYSYIGSRAIPASALPLLMLLLIFGRSALLNNCRGLTLLTLGGWVAVSPLLPWVITHSDVFNSRLNQTGILQTGWLYVQAAQHGVLPIQILVERIKDAALVFNVQYVDFFYQADVPMLGLLTSGLFFLGLIYAIVKLRQLSFLIIHSWFWLTFFTGQVLLVPTAAYRTMSLLVVACILGAIALDKLACIISAGFASNKFWALIVATVLLFEARWNIDYYYFKWAPGYQYCTTLGCRGASLLAEYVVGLEPHSKVYVFTDSVVYSQGWAVTEYLAHGRTIIDIEDNLPQALPEISPGQKVAFVFAPDRLDEMPVIVDKYPGGRRHERYLGPFLYFVAYETER